MITFKVNISIVGLEPDFWNLIFSNHHWYYNQILIVTKQFSGFALKMLTDLDCKDIWDLPGLLFTDGQWYVGWLQGRRK